MLWQVQVALQEVLQDQFIQEKDMVVMVEV